MPVLLSILLWLGIALTPLGTLLEASLLGHMLVEIPMLISIGVIIGIRIKDKINAVLGSVNINGIPGILISCFTLAFWMIPRWLDASVNIEYIAYLKYLSLPLLAGIPLACSWQNLHPIARGVIKIEFLTMLFRLGWLYLISPDRLCNNYLLSEQKLVGQYLIIAGFTIGIIWLVQVFFRTSDTKTHSQNNIIKPSIN